jgi:hypothetical protein
MSFSFALLGESLTEDHLMKLYCSLICEDLNESTLSHIYIYLFLSLRQIALAATRSAQCVMRVAFRNGKVWWLATLGLLHKIHPNVSVALLKQIVLIQKL